MNYSTNISQQTSRGRGWDMDNSTPLLLAAVALSSLSHLSISLFPSLSPSPSLFHSVPFISHSSAPSASLVHCLSLFSLFLFCVFLCPLACLFACLLLPKSRFFLQLSLVHHRTARPPHFSFQFSAFTTTTTSLCLPLSLSLLLFSPPACFSALFQWHNHTDRHRHTYNPFNFSLPESIHSSSKATAS